MKKIFTSLAILSTATFCFGQIFNSGFEDNNGTPLSAWKKINGDGLTVPVWAPVQDFNTEAWIQFYEGFDNKIAMSTGNYDPTGKADDWLISPKITLPATGNPTLYFSMEGYSFPDSDSYEVRVSTTTDDKASFTNIALSVSPEVSYSYNKRTVDLSAYKGQNIYIAFVNNSNSADAQYLRLEDVYISNSQNCEKPDSSTFTVSNLTDTSFTGNWGAVTGVTNYDVGLTTFTVPVTSNGIQTALTKNYSGLSPQTRYQLFVKNADCGSGWSTPFSVFTPSVLPYSYGFEPTTENYGEYESDGWVSTTWIMGVNPAAAQSGSGYAYNNTSKSFAKNDWLFSYPIRLNAGDEIEVKYFAQMSLANATSADFKVGIYTKPDKAAANLVQILSTTKVPGGAYQEYTTNYIATTTGNYYVGFGNVTPKLAATDVNASLRLDNIRIKKVTNMATEDAAKKVSKIYPIPVVNDLNIASENKLLKAEILNQEGRLIISTDIKGNKINVSSLPKGMYILKLKTDKGIEMHKFLK